MICVLSQEFAECIATIFLLDCESRLVCDKLKFDIWNVILKWIAVQTNDNNDNISTQKLSKE